MEERRLRLQEEANRYYNYSCREVMFIAEGYSKDVDVGCSLISLTHHLMRSVFRLRNHFYRLEFQNENALKNGGYGADISYFVTRRFAASGSVTAEEQEQRILYANVLEYEQDHVRSTSC